MYILMWYLRKIQHHLCDTPAKVHDLNLVVRKHQTNQKLIYTLKILCTSKMSRSWKQKNKDKKGLQNCSQLKLSKKTEKLNAKCDPRPEKKTAIRNIIGAIGTICKRCIDCNIVLMLGYLILIIEPSFCKRAPLFLNDHSEIFGLKRHESATYSCTDRGGGRERGECVCCVCRKSNKANMTKCY